MMQILFDGRFIKTNEEEILPIGGIGRYSYNLLKHLVERGKDIEITILVPASNKRKIFEQSNYRVEEKKYADNPSSLRTQFFLGRQIDSRQFDIFHSPFNMLPRGLNCKKVVTIHDMMWLTNSRLCARFLPERLAAGLLYRLGIGSALRTADRIITISHASGEAIRRYLPENSGRLEVIHHGTDPFFSKIPKQDASRELEPLLHLPAIFVLCVGQGSPYKNHARAIKAFMRESSARPGMKLILVRRFQRIDGEMQALLEQNDVRERVIILPHVSDRQIRALYTLATFLLFPSIEEGFGLPLLEAMACDTPVITSDIPIMREVAGNAALFINPLDIEDIAAGISRLLADQTLQQELVIRGRERLRQFSWHKCAESTMACYLKAMDTRQEGCHR